MDGSLRWCVSSPFWHLDAVRGPSTPSFDDLVGAGEQRLRHGEAERVSGLQVDHQFELGRLLDRQIGRLGALEDLSDVNAGLAENSREARSIADQSARLSELTRDIDRRDGMARGQRRQSHYPAGEEWVGADEERVGMYLHELREGSIDLAIGPGLQNR